MIEWKPTINQSSTRHTLKNSIAIILCAALFALLAMDIRGPYFTAALDSGVYNAIRKMESPFTTGLFLVITNLVNPAVLLIVSLSMIHVLKQSKYLIPLFGNLFLTVLLNLAIKSSFMRVRPPEEMRLVVETGYSFPSGHSMVAASFYGFLIFLLSQAVVSRKKKLLGDICFLLIPFCVGCSRIYLGVHYTTDVLGGYLVAVIYLILFTTIVKRYLEAESNLEEKLTGLAGKRKLTASFLHAFNGIGEGIRNEPNMMIHYSVTGLVVVFGITLHLTVMEWSICLILCGLVISMELINTAIEATVDLVTDQFKELAKLAKDTAAGAVLVSAITAAIVGGMIFFPKLVALFT